MATIITSDCINCGACEPECPNTAIYQGGVEWELNGVKHPAISADIFFIVRDKCTECVGFFDHEACAAVCPVDCCIPDPNNPETEAVLLARAQQLHSDKTFGDNSPSRFRKAGAAKAWEAAPAEKEKPTAKAPDPAAKPASPAAVPPVESQTAAPAPPPAPTPAATAPPPAATAAKPVAAKAPATEAAASTGARAETPAAAAAQAPVAPASAVPGPEEWDIPIECFHCGRDYAVAFKHFRSGVVLYCPSCHGSYVVTTSLYGSVSRAVRQFHTRWREQVLHAQAERPTEMEPIDETQRAQLGEFLAALKAASRDIRVPGAPRKRAGMFG
jgi:ferredoxin